MEYDAAAHAEQVLIRGKCFLYRQKAPFVPSGKSVHGALEYEQKTDRVRCHECGQWYRMLSTHVARAHSIAPRDYKKKHGLRRLCALCGPGVSLAMVRGKENYYQRLRVTTRSPEGRARFAEIGRQSGSRQGNTAIAERRNEEGRCAAQLAERLKQLQEHYGRTPTSAELMDKGLSPQSICLVFNLKTMRQVYQSLAMAYEPKRQENPNAYPREALIIRLRDYWAKYGKRPSKMHMRMGLVPTWDVFKRVFGSMRAAYEAAGLTALTESRSSYTRDGLIEQIQEYYRQHGEVPRASRKFGRKYGDALPPGFPTTHVFKRIFGSMAGAYVAAGLT
jgi:hypothetical protein